MHFICEICGRDVWWEINGQPMHGTLDSADAADLMADYHAPYPVKTAGHDQPVSPWVQRAIAGTLPASDRTGTVRA